LINITVKDLDGCIHEIQGHQGDSLMDVLREHEWGVPALCGGLLSCGTCQVYVNEKWLEKLPAIDPEEQDLLRQLEAEETNTRLSCQLQLQDLHDGLEVTIAPHE